MVSQFMASLDHFELCFPVYEIHEFFLELIFETRRNPGPFSFPSLRVDPNLSRAEVRSGDPSSARLASGVGVRFSQISFTVSLSNSCGIGACWARRGIPLSLLSHRFLEDRDSSRYVELWFGEFSL